MYYKLIISLDEVPFSVKKYDFFSYFSTKHNVVRCSFEVALRDILLMSTQNLNVSRDKLYKKNILLEILFI